LYNSNDFIIFKFHILDSTFSDTTVAFGVLFALFAAGGSVAKAERQLGDLVE
jgi:hypothetical protein